MDHEDAHTVTVDLPVLRFDKTVTNVTTGQNPATHATPGDTLRYRIRIENLATNPLPNFTLRDELGRLNNAAVYVPGTLNVVTVPAGADASNTNPSGGVNNAGLVDIRNLSLGGLGTFIVIEYDVRLVRRCCRTRATCRTRRRRTSSGIEVARSDDPNVGATAPDPLVLGDEDPTRVQITSAPKFRVLKTSTYLGASTTVLRAGDRLRYTITVKNIGTDNATGVVDSRPDPGEHDLRRRQHDAERYAAERQRAGHHAAGRRHCGLRAGGRDAGRDARRCDQHAEQRRDDHVRRDGLSGSARWHDHLEPGVRERGRLRHRRLPVRRSAHADRERPDARRGRQRAAAVRHQAGGAAGRQRLAGHRRSGRHAALHDHDLQQRRDSGDQRGAGRQRSAEHHLRRELDDAERPAVRPAGQRLVAARGRYVRELDRSHAAAAGSGRGHALAELERGRSVRSARERRRRRPARSSATRRSCARRRCRTC